MNSEQRPEESNKSENPERVEASTPSLDVSASKLTPDVSVSPVTSENMAEEFIVVSDAIAKEKVSLVESSSEEIKVEESEIPAEIQDNSETAASNSVSPANPENEDGEDSDAIASVSPTDIENEEIKDGDALASVSPTEKENDALASVYPADRGNEEIKDGDAIASVSPTKKENEEIEDSDAIASVSPANLENEEKEDSDAIASPMRIFITGASGCIGHYLVETLIEKTDYELFLLVRNPTKLRFNYRARPGINIIQGDMRDIKRFAKLLKTMHCAILVATAWGGQDAIDVNVFKNIQLLNRLDPQVCQHIIYFSTASVLGRNSQLLKEAGNAGTDYIRSKFDFLRQVSRLPIAKKMTVLFPTLVLGGDDIHPYSHISSGLPDMTKEIEIMHFLNKPLLKVKPVDLIRYFKADGSFHFIHAQDIATVVRHLVEHPLKEGDARWLVLGNQAVTLNQIVAETCAYLNKPIGHRLELTPWLTNFFIKLFKIQMSAWDRFSLDYRHFTYEYPVSPTTYGLPTYCPTFRDVLKISRIPIR